jgi:L-threonylcarbamoyladenylate synthase
VSSANISGQPAALTVAQAQEQLGDDVAVYLDGGPSTTGVASTIVDVTAEIPLILRTGAVSAQALREVVPDIAG